MSSVMVDRLVDVMIQKHLERHQLQLRADPLPPASFYEKVAHALLNELRNVPEVCWDQYRCEKVWRELDSTQVWNLWLDAVLEPT